MGLVRIEPPQGLPVSVEEARRQVRVDGDHEDALLERLIRAATARLDGDKGRLGRCLMPQVWELRLDAFPAGGAIELPLAPVIEIVQVTYQDLDGVFVPLPAERWILDNAVEPAWLFPAGPEGEAAAGWPATFDRPTAVRIRYRAGYRGDVLVPPVSDAEAVPEPLRHAILLMVGSWYATREDHVVGTSVARLPDGVEALTEGYRIWSGVW